MLYPVLAVGIGSFFGGICRFLLSHALARYSSDFPLGTFSVNVLGCFLIGVILSLFPDNTVHANYRMLLAVGFCGSFTTFSTFSAENLSLLQSKAYWLVAVYIAASVVTGLIAVFAGMAAGKRFI